ncbi:hypothetical protein [Capnocytophaga catalasegens]|uniref:DUF7832 domain-containing protein n=1 Tax=Capnocytophaga catalasegens TaxID=1004260 RepID=A0AAV5APX7_9FLAO|nr:hypothetical protein [Capnocytophaga catalasegens]GIZ14923.1 hypothetical protein RCZ03_09230 [Capnocytophaga catalasegens]GJM49302.1 hypothetical protein RCZ15_02770 [Capnocytophaga catalasegens]GJM52453.1 hypothetical protein RCZ16_07700 [Capnocytophaga catalasegens]
MSVVYSQMALGAENAPTDIPQENGATHIAFFLRWIIEKGLYSKEFLEDFPEEIKSIEKNDKQVGL